MRSSLHLASTAVRLGALFGCRTNRVQVFRAFGGGGSSGIGTDFYPITRNGVTMTSGNIASTSTGDERIGVGGAATSAGPALRTFVDGNASGPVLVFVHGWPDDHTMWDKQVRSSSSSSSRSSRSSRSSTAICSNSTAIDNFWI